MRQRLIYNANACQLLHHIRDLLLESVGLFKHFHDEVDVILEVVDV